MKLGGLILGVRKNKDGTYDSRSKAAKNAESIDKLLTFGANTTKFTAKLFFYWPVKYFIFYPLLGILWLFTNPIGETIAGALFLYSYFTSSTSDIAANNPDSLDPWQLLSLGVGLILLGVIRLFLKKRKISKMDDDPSIEENPVDNVEE